MLTFVAAWKICLCTVLIAHADAGASKDSPNWTTATYAVRNEIAQKLKELLSQPGVAGHTLKIVPDEKDQSLSKLVIRTSPSNHRAIGSFVLLLNGRTLEKSRPVMTRESIAFEKFISAGITD